MPLYFAIYQKILADNVFISIYLYVFDYFLSVTISETKGQLVGNSHILIHALTFINSSILRRSSETLCENLKHLNIHKPKHIKPISDEEFGYYLAGFIEGSGHFINQNLLVMSFHIQDIRLAYFIKSRLGYGSVKNNKLLISNKEGLFKIINLINGKIRTPIIYNQISLISPQLSLDNSTFSNNYWLAGFCDANASFQVKIIYRQLIKLPEVRLNLQICHKNNFLLQKILEEFGGSIRYCQKTDIYYYSSINNNIAYKFISYFRIYHLSSYKYVNYLKWCKVYSFIQENLTNESFNKILSQKESMNSK